MGVRPQGRVEAVAEAEAVVLAFPPQVGFESLQIHLGSPAVVLALLVCFLQLLELVVFDLEQVK